MTKINKKSAGIASVAHTDLTDMPSALNTDHDGRYYTESEVNSLTANHPHQDVTTGASPTLTAANFSDGGSNAIITTTQETNFETAYTHSQDNTQAHSDYLLNSGSDIMTGTLTADGLTLGTNELITLSTGTIKHDSTDFVFDDDINITSNNLKTTGLIKNMTQCWDFCVFNPSIAYNIDTQVFLLYVKSALTITKLHVELNTTAQEVAGDLKYADDFTALTNATVINDFDTTSGVRTDTSITSGAVAAGKCVYIQFDSQPNIAITQMQVHVEYDLD